MATSYLEYPTWVNSRENGGDAGGQILNLPSISVETPKFPLFNFTVTPGKGCLLCESITRPVTQSCEMAETLIMKRKIKGINNFENFISTILMAV
jgi:hypothetical protein